MVKPRVYGKKYELGIAVVKSGLCGFHTQAKIDSMSTEVLYGLLHSYKYVWSKREQRWRKDVNGAKLAVTTARGVFAGILPRQQLAIRIVTHRSQIDAQIASAKDLYELLGAELLKTVGPVNAKRGEDKALAYLYFKLPR